MKIVNTTHKQILKIVQPIDQKAHKGMLGHALIIGGSYGKMGSITLSAKASLKTGCGLVTAYIPRCGYQILQVAIPEVMVLTDHNEKEICSIEFDFTPDAIGIGPGMGTNKQTKVALTSFLTNNKTQLVVDADALNIIAEHRTLLELLPEKSILTPHPKELERLIGPWRTEGEKFEKAAKLSSDFDLILVLKGAPTFVMYNDVMSQNITGNSALATAGSGDVLTGIITSLLAQGYIPEDAAKLGVYLHGLTADIALPETGYQSFIASDIINNLGKAWLKLYQIE